MTGGRAAPAVRSPVREHSWEKVSRKAGSHQWLCPRCGARVTAILDARRGVPAELLRRLGVEQDCDVQAARGVVEQ